MKITAIETIRLPDRPNLLLVQVHTDEGLVGLGETSRGPGPVEAQIHDLSAPVLLGEDPLAIQKHNRALMATYLGFSSSSTEVRAASALDITTKPYPFLRPSGPVPSSTKSLLRLIPLKKPPFSGMGITKSARPESRLTVICSPG